MECDRHHTCSTVMNCSLKDDILHKLSPMLPAIDVCTFSKDEYIPRKNDHSLVSI